MVRVRWIEPWRYDVKFFDLSLHCIATHVLGSICIIKLVYFFLFLSVTVGKEVLSFSSSSFLSGFLSSLVWFGVFFTAGRRKKGNGQLQ